MLKTKQALQTNLSERELEALGSYEAICGKSAALTLTQARKVESRYKLARFEATHEAKQVSAELRVNSFAELLEAKASRCPSAWLHGSDAVGHRFGKELHCGAEWCPVCGQKESAMHVRRWSKWVPKAQQVKSLGLMVIELPLVSRNKLRSRKALESYGKLTVEVVTGNYEVRQRRAAGEMLRRGAVAEIKARYGHYFGRGMRRWHYFGDVKKELGKLGLNMQLEAEAEVSALDASVKSNVHLNLLLDAGYIPKPFLEHIKRLLGQAWGEPKLIVHYGYASKPGQMIHVLKYTTRATFLDISWDKWLAGQLYGFRNGRSWGKWVKVDKLTGKLPAEAAVWPMSEVFAEVDGVKVESINALGLSRCPKDGLKITWIRRPIGELREAQAQGDVVSLGGGFYELPSVKPVASVPESDVLYWHRLMAKAEAINSRDAKLAAYASTSPDAIAWSLLPDMVNSKHYKHDFLLRESDLDALWGAG